MLRINRLAAAVVLAVVLSSFAIVAQASIPGSDGTINGCYAKSGALSVIDSTATCPKGDTALNWNQTGPTGPQGPGGAQGTPGQTGPAGPAGANGNTVLSGTGAPPASLGTNGDFYLDTAAEVLYGPKANGAWSSSGTSLVGPTGAVGATGPAGPVGATGATGPAGPVGATGATGATGSPGVQGPAGAQGPAGPSSAGPQGLDILSDFHTGTGIFTFNCPSDHPYAISGSAFDQANQAPVTNFPLNTGTNTGWVAEGPGNDTVTLYVICAK